MCLELLIFVFRKFLRGLHTGTRHCTRVVRIDGQQTNRPHLIHRPRDFQCVAHEVGGEKWGGVGRNEIEECAQFWVGMRLSVESNGAWTARVDGSEISVLLALQLARLFVYIDCHRQHLLRAATYGLRNIRLNIIQLDAQLVIHR